jgi:hypothetical protein
MSYKEEPTERCGSSSLPHCNPWKGKVGIVCIGLPVRKLELEISSARG